MSQRKLFLFHLFQALWVYINGIQLANRTIIKIIQFFKSFTVSTFKWCYYVSRLCHSMKTRLVLWCLTPLSIICQLYRGGKFYWRRKQEYPEKTTNAKKVESVWPLLLGQIYLIWFFQLTDTDWIWISLKSKKYENNNNNTILTE
jgi:hypothetical protein